MGVLPNGMLTSPHKGSHHIAFSLLPKGGHCSTLPPKGGHGLVLHTMSVISSMMGPPVGPISLGPLRATLHSSSSSTTVVPG